MGWPGTQLHFLLQNRRPQHAEHTKYSTVSVAQVVMAAGSWCVAYPLRSLWLYLRCLAPVLLRNGVPLGSLAYGLPLRHAADLAAPMSSFLGGTASPLTRFRSCLRPVADE